jgi:hypothetical protein
MNAATNYYANSELAMAAYANLIPGVNPIPALTYKDCGMSPAQAARFADTYTVVAQYDDSVTGFGATSFSATVFKDASGNLTLAIRGTAELTGSPNDLTTDADIAISGAGYDQIVAMVNWWLRASTPAGNTVLQYEITSQPIDLHDGFQFGNSWIRILPPVAATGELVNAISGDADHKLDITGHSLGGHLAMAFGSFFAAATNEVMVFNAPGFIDSATNRSFFSALGGSVPSGVSTTNVIADGANVGAYTRHLSIDSLMTRLASNDETRLAA